MTGDKIPDDRREDFLPEKKSKFSLKKIFEWKKKPIKTAF
jgi:hypothetical protein